MPRFKVEYATSDGRLTTAEMDGASERSLLAMIETRGQTPISLRALDSASVTSRTGRRGRGGGSLRRAVLDFTHQMTAVTESGIPVIAGLQAVSEQTEHAGLRGALRRIADRVEGGASLAEAMTPESAFFPGVYTKTVAAGEASGTLPDVFASLARYLEETAETRAAVLSALMYPALVVGALVIATICLLIFVIPKFQEMFERFGAELPLPTRIVVGVSAGLREHWIELLAIIAMLVVGSKAALANPRIRAWYDERKLRLPIFGRVILGAYMQRMVELLNLLTRSALPILQTLRVTADSVENEAFRQDLRRMQRAVEGGHSLGEAFAETRWLTPLVKRMLAIGEQAGRTDQIFEYLARYYGQQTKRIVKTLSTLVEPVLIGCLAVVILFFALSIFLPMFKVLRMVGSA